MEPDVAMTGLRGVSPREVENNGREIGGGDGAGKTAPLPKVARLITGTFSDVRGMLARPDAGHPHRRLRRLRRLTQPRPDRRGVAVLASRGSTDERPVEPVRALSMSGPGAPTTLPVAVATPWLNGGPAAMR
nr:hypothetical protein [uncultured Jannaschia sp.]